MDFAAYFERDFVHCEEEKMKKTKGKGDMNALIHGCLDS